MRIVMQEQSIQEVDSVKESRDKPINGALI